MSLARGTDDPSVKGRYERLALELMEHAGDRPDAEEERMPAVIGKTDTGDANPHR
jgi:hypothetical protein